MPKTIMNIWKLCEKLASAKVGLFESLVQKICVSLVIGVSF